VKLARLRKVRRNHRAFFLILHVGLAWYLLMITALHLTSSTNALFTSQAVIETSVQVGPWLDDSTLTFTRVGYDSNEIYAYIQNNGPGDMAYNTTYFVYYSEKGNPVSPQGETGELVYSEGIIPIMAVNGESVKLTYSPTKKGFYQFVVFQNHQEPVGKEVVINGKAAAISNKINANK
jgi:YqxM protein